MGERSAARACAPTCGRGLDHSAAAVTTFTQPGKEDMADPSNPSKPFPGAPITDEARMRQALGLSDDGAVPRLPQRREPEVRGRRFVRDGEVPVVVLNAAKDASAVGPATPHSRVAAAEAALRAERLAHQQTEQALKDAQAAVGRLETKLAHAELAHSEALAAERASRESAERARDEAAAARVALEARIAELTPVERPRRGRKPGAVPAKRPAAKPRRKAADAKQREPQPVKWWLPSYRAKLRKK